MKLAAVIPARAGSKRLKDKNDRTIGGYTLVEWAIAAAKSIEHRCSTFILTDSDTTKETSKKYDVSVLERPESLSTDDASTESLIKHFISNSDFTDIVLLQPTSPFRSIVEINHALKTYQEMNLLSLAAVCKPWQAPKDLIVRGTDGKFLQQLVSEKKLGALDYFFDTGSLYISSSKRLLSGKLFVDNDTYLFECGSLGNIDIDTNFQLEIARSLFAEKFQAASVFDALCQVTEAYP